MPTSTKITGVLSPKELSSIPLGIEGKYSILDTFGKVLIERKSDCCRTDLLQVAPNSEHRTGIRFVIEFEE